MTAAVLCAAVAAIPVVLFVGCVRCRRALNQPTNKESNHE